MVEAEDLAIAGGAEADLSDLVEKALKPVGLERYRVDPGPTVNLKKAQLVPVSLILHELVTNAWKYGAFSKPGGLAHLTWSVEPKDNAKVLRITWRPSGRPSEEGSLARR